MKHFFRNFALLFALTLIILAVGSLGLQAQGKYFSQMGHSLSASYDKFSHYSDFEVAYIHHGILKVSYEQLEVSLMAEGDFINRVTIHRTFDSRKDSREFKALFLEVMGYIQASQTLNIETKNLIFKEYIYKNRQYSLSYQKLCKGQYSVRLTADLLPKEVNIDGFFAFVPQNK